MKRRDFIVQSAGAAGALLPVLAVGQAVRPCPPPSVSVAGGSTASTGCSPLSGQADWLARSTGPGVVWSHNFDTGAEVDQFRWQGGIGNVPNVAQSDGKTKWVADGFAGGGCVEIAIPTGGTVATNWWRPLSALRAGDNGKSTDDPAAGGTLQRRAWNSGSVSQNWDWRKGYYGHTDYHSQYATWVGQSNVWDGTDFYLQFRAKMSASRFNAANPLGKLMYIDVTGITGSQEVLIRSPNKKTWLTTGEFDMYTSQGNFYQSYLTNPQGGNFNSSRQPGGVFESTCRIIDGNGGPHPPQTCWEWPTDEWVTILILVTPGKDNSGQSGVTWDNPATWLSQVPFKDFGIEVWVARAGATTYTKIWNKMDYAWRYDSNGRHPPAFNAISPSGYMNGVAAAVGWYQRYTQFIFSKQFIPCPQA
jgi:hypothetical protein